MLIGPDGRFLRPGTGEPTLLPTGETPTPQIYLQEMTAGKLIAGVTWFEPGETWKGSRAMLLHFTTGDRLLIGAMVAMDRRYATRLFFRWIEAEHIWTKRMEAELGQGLGRLLPADEIQKRLQGHLVVRVIPIREPTPEGGEQLRMEFSDGESMRVSALPGEHPLCADLLVEWLAT